VCACLSLYFFLSPSLSLLLRVLGMKVATKFVAPLPADQVTQLHHILDTSPQKRVRMRAHAVLLSAKGLCIHEIACIYEVHRDTVSSWIDKWTSSGLDALYDRPRRGGPCKLNEAEHALAYALLQAHPHAPRRVLGLIEQKTGKTSSRSNLRRLAQKRGLTWKRVRKSVRSKRDEAAFGTAQQTLATLKKTSG